MTVFEKLQKKIKQDTGLSLDKFKRTYAGVHMKASGAHTWVAYFKNERMTIGSVYSATELLKAKKLCVIWGDPFPDIMPEDDIN